MLSNRSRLYTIGLAGLAVLASASQAAAQVTTDLWDVNQGGSILTSSGSGPGDLRNMFGGVFSSPEPGTAFFRDDRPAGFTHFVEFQSDSPIALTGYNLFALDDALNPGDRGFTEFRLFAFDSGISSFQLLDTFTPASHPYGFITVSETFAPVIAQRFRAEFDQFAGFNFPGPRIVELDAIATAVPEPASIVMLGIGALGLVGYGWRRRRSPA